MRHTRYRRLDTLVIGADPKKLQQPGMEVTVPVDWPGRGQWQANTAQVKAIMLKARALGGSIEAQRANGDWEKIYAYKTVKGVRMACGVATGLWFEVQALREVL